jgi:adenylate cyclase
MAEERIDRRLAAIFAGDIAGYSRLMSIDEEGTLRQLKAHRKDLVDPKIIEHRGRIVKTTGDGMLVEFVSVVDAVRCAVDIQRGMVDRNTHVPPEKRIQFRIGLNVGDIIIDGDDIYGDGVNVAARLEALAEPGGIMVSRVVHDQVQDKLSFGFDDLGEQTVKNIARPVGVHRIQLTDPTIPVKAATGTTERTSTDRPSIAVLPFANMSGDAEQEYFADGISEDIITGLSKLRWFFIIARNSSFAYKGKAVDVKRAARELGVRYVLEGSVRKGGNRVRITAQLIDAATGNHIWADRYDGELTDVFALQDEITRKVVAAIEPKLLEAEGIRSQNRSPEDLGAWDQMRAAELDDSDPWAHMALGYVAFSMRRTEQAVEEFRQALELNPNFAAAHGYMGFALAMDGRSDEAIPHAEQAIQMSPHDPQNAIFNTAIAVAQYLAGRYPEAVVFGRKALQQRTQFTSGHRIYVASLAQAGQIDEARESLKQLKETFPEMTIAWIERYVPYTARTMPKFLEGMRKAGLE